MIEDLKEQERQTLSLGSALETERAGHKERLEDLEAAHAKELATVSENHMRKLAEAEVKHEQDLTRVKLWCEMNQPRPNELARILERQRRSTLQAEMKKLKEETGMSNSWDEARIRELERENSKLKHHLAKV